MEKKRLTHLNNFAFQTVTEASGQEPIQEDPTKSLAKEKILAAVRLRHLWGLKGGPAMAKKVMRQEAQGNS